MTGRKKRSFLGQFLGDRDVAAVSHSSSYLIRRLLGHLDPANTRLLVELGPGDGVATKALLAVLPKDARLLAIEKNPGFAADLAVLGDPRLEVIQGDARRLQEILNEKGIGSADAVIASIPFTYLSRSERHALVRSAKMLLKPEGRFIIFHQYSRLMAPYVRQAFPRVRIEFEPLNIFPCFLIDSRNQ